MWASLFVLAIFVQQISGIDPSDERHSPFPRRNWEVAQRYYVGDKSFYKRAIFPSIRQCVKTEDILLVQLDIAGATGDQYAGPDTRTWSAFLNNFIFFNIDVIREDAEYKKLSQNMIHDVRYLAARFGVTVMMLMMFLITICAFIALPIIGLVFFRVLFCIWRILTTTPMRRFGRYLVIRAELMRRKRQRFLVPILINKNVPRRFYRVPRWFREDSDEDEPEILRNFQGTIAVQIKDSDSEVSLHQLYQEYYKDGEPIVRTDPKTGIPLTIQQLEQAKQRSSPNVESPTQAIRRKSVTFHHHEKHPGESDSENDEEDHDTDYDADDDEEERKRTAK